MFVLIQRLLGALIVAGFSMLVTFVFARFFVLPDLMKLEPEPLRIYSLIIGGVFGAIAGFLRWRHYQKTDLRAADPPPLPSARSSGMSPGFAWALALLIGVPFAYMVVKSQAQKMAQGRLPGSSEFHAANLLITGKSKGTAHGNTPEAKALAAEFSQYLKMARKMGIESRKSPAIVSLTGGEFLTYCLLTEDSCVFMVHVPDLRKFAVDAKDFIAEAAWQTAQGMTQKRLTSHPGLRNLVVGIRGSILYDRALYGPSGNASGAENIPPTVVRGDTEAEKALIRYFAPATRPSIAAVTGQNGQK